MNVRSMRRIVAGTVAAVFLATGAVNSTASADPNQGNERREGERMTATRRGDTVEYEYRNDLPRSQRRTYNGRKSADGTCSYLGRGEFRPGQAPVVVIEREIRNDMDRCVMTTEWASLTPEEASQAGYSRRPSGDGEIITDEQSQASDPSLGTESHTNFSHRGHLKTYYEEPAQGDVSTVEAHVGWTFNGSCVTSWGTHAYWHWLNDTGWTDVSRWADWPGGCAERTARVYGKFKNGVFCATNDTFTEFNTTSYTGLANGGARWAWNSNKWGGCNWFLSHHVEAYYLGQRQ